MDAAWVRDTATRVRDEIAARRSTWQVWHVRGRGTPSGPGRANLPAEHVDAVVDLVTDHTLALASVSDTRRDGIEDPPEPSPLTASLICLTVGSWQVYIDQLG